MDLVDILKNLANGINPETGKKLPTKSITHKTETIRILFALIDELNTADCNEKPVKKKASKPRVDDEEKIQKNLAEGKPKRSHLYWSDEEQEKVCSMFGAGASVEAIAAKVMRGT